MKRAFTLIEAAIVIGIVVILAAILFPVFFLRPHPAGRRSECQSNLKQIGLGFIQYAEDMGERFPPARATSTTGWADVLQPYIKSTRIFQCPSTQNSTAPLTDYFYNSRMARLSMEKLDSPALTILAGDGDDDAPTWVSLSQLPSSWVKDEKSPAWRHLSVANYLFADGHVKSLKADKISTASSQNATATFAIR